MTKFYLKLSSVVLMAIVYLSSCEETNIEPAAADDNAAVEQEIAAATHASRWIDFNRPNGKYWAGNCNGDFGNCGGYSSAEINRTFIDGKRQKIILAKNEVLNGGTTYNVNVASGKSYRLEYRVYFPNNFQWKGGGKLPGLAGSAAFTGCSGLKGANGEWGVRRGDGWSARIMWHQWFSVNNNVPYIDPYLYYFNMNQACGQGFGQRVSIAKNKWLQIKMDVTVNTANWKSDGKIWIQIDGKTLLSRNNIRWANQNKGRVVDKVLWHVYRGGGKTPSYTTNVDTHLFIDNVWFKRNY